MEEISGSLFVCVKWIPFSDIETIRWDSTVLWNRAKVKTNDVERISQPELCQLRQRLHWPVWVLLRWIAGTCGGAGWMVTPTINRVSREHPWQGGRLSDTDSPPEEMPCGRKCSMLGGWECLIVMEEVEGAVGRKRGALGEAERSWGRGGLGGGGSVGGHMEEWRWWWMCKKNFINCMLYLRRHFRHRILSNVCDYHL